tara:strand:- start:816 stop:1247 length:432 start_codon:yes stop_codon:yes gene_type:complete
MDKDIKYLLNKIGLPFEESDELLNQLVPRDIFLDKEVYKEIYNEIPILKAYLKSSKYTCLHNNAEINQRWPLLNITRQILRNHNYKMEPIRKAEGYTEDGTKIYKRYFLICKIPEIEYETEDENDEEDDPKNINLEDISNNDI